MGEADVQAENTQTPIKTKQLNFKIEGATIFLFLLNSSFRNQ